MRRPRWTKTLLDQGQWKELESADKIEALQAVAALSCARMGIPAAGIQVVGLPFNTLGQFSSEKNLIQISPRCWTGTSQKLLPSFSTNAATSFRSSSPRRWTGQAPQAPPPTLTRRGSGTTICWTSVLRGGLCHAAGGSGRQCIQRRRNFPLHRLSGAADGIYAVEKDPKIFGKADAK